MKDGTLYAERFKKVYGKLRSAPDSATRPYPTDPIACLALGILGSDQGPERARRQLDRLLSSVVDFNELRVSSPADLAALIGDNAPEVLARCRTLIDALQAIYDRENKLSLDRLRSLGRREARQYLESLKGVDEYAAAFLLLFCLGGHAIPVPTHSLEHLRSENLVHPFASRSEVQAFLERNTPAQYAKPLALKLAAVPRSKKQPSSRRTSLPAKKKSHKGAASK